MASRTYRTVHGSFSDTQINNSWVVPFSPRLSIMFQCHQNLELCISRVGEIKYLLEYVCKGQNRVSVQSVCGEQYYDETGKF